MSSRYTSPFDDLLDKNRRDLDALYRGAGGSLPRRTSAPPVGPAAAAPDPAERSSPPPRSRERETSPPGPATTSAEPASSTASPAERLLSERYGDGWRFEITSRRRERDEVIVVGTLRLPGPGGVRTQFGSARISTAGGSATGSAGGIAFSFAGENRVNSLAAEEAAFERACEDALMSCASL